jgi:hypothetical protein
LLTAEAMPECRESTLARTVAVIGAISAPRPTPNTISEGNTAERYPSSGWICAISNSPAPVRTAPTVSGIRGPIRWAIAPDGVERVKSSKVIGSVAAPA